MRILLLTLLALSLPAALGAQLPLDTLRLGAVRFLAWPETRALTAALRGSAQRGPPFPGIDETVLRDGAPVTVYVTPDERRFRAQTGGRAPDWGAGVAFPAQNVIVLPGYTSAGRGGAQDLHRVLRHELAHVALQRRLGGLRVPRWFTEGYATWSAHQLDQDAAWLLRLAFIFERAPALDSLELTWPRAQTDAHVAYLLSATAVEYLYRLGSPATFTAFLDAWSTGGSMELALRQSYRLSSAQFERLWRRDVKQRYGWLLFVTQGAVFALFFTVIVLVLFGIRRRRDRRKLAALRAAEPPDTPAYWLEPPAPGPEGAAADEPSP